MTGLQRIGAPDWDVSVLDDPITHSIFHRVRLGGPVTKAALEIKTGYSRPTVAQRVRELIDSGLLVPTSTTVFSGGRPAAGLAFNSEGATIACVDIGEKVTRVALADASGRVIDQSAMSVDVAVGPGVLLDDVVAAIRSLLGENATTASRLAGVGVGLPAPVDYASGTTQGWSVMSGWSGFDIRSSLEKALDVPVIIDNDVNLLALAEYRRHWPELRHVLYVKVGTGIGSGLIVDGHLNRGAQGAAGDLGHVHLKGHGDPVCRCGNRGCVEALVAGWSLAALLDVPSGEARDVAVLVRRGDASAVRALRDAGRMLGEVLATATSLLNPSALVLGGVLARTGDHLLAGVREVVYQQTLPLASKSLIVQQGNLGPEGGIVGAALLTVDELLRN